MSYLKELSFSDIVPDVSKIFPTIDCQSFGSFHLMAFSNSNYVITLNWSMDQGVNTDKNQVSDIITAGDTYELSGKIRARYLTVVYIDSTAVGGKTLRLQMSLNCNGPALSLLENVGDGSKIYSPEDLAIRTITSSDGSISITENVNTIDITGNSGSPYEENNNLIEPVLATQTSAITNGLNNTINGTPLKCSIVGGEDNTISDSTGALISSSNTCTIQGLGINNCSIISSGDGCFIDGETFSTTTEGNRCSIIASENCWMGINFIGVSQDCGTNNIIGGCIDSFITNSSNNCGIYSSNDCSLDGGSSKTCVIMGGNDTYTTGNHNNVFLVGDHITCSANGVFAFSDRDGGTRLTPSVSNSAYFRTSGGYNIYTNNSNSTGVTIAAGSSSWAVVCDRNQKENLVQCVGSEILDKLKQINVYCFNYKNVRPEQKNIGPVAQEWHKQFACANVQDPLYDEEDNVLYDEEGNIRKGPPHPAKDPKKIEMLDMVGVLLSSVKELASRVETMQEEITRLKRNGL